MHSIRSHWPCHHACIPGEFHMYASWSSPRAMPKLLGHGGSHGHAASHPTWLCPTTHVAGYAALLMPNLPTMFSQIQSSPCTPLLQACNPQSCSDTFTRRWPRFTPPVKAKKAPGIRRSNVRRFPAVGCAFGRGHGRCNSHIYTMRPVVYQVVGAILLLDGPQRCNDKLGETLLSITPSHLYHCPPAWPQPETAPAQHRLIGWPRYKFLVSAHPNSLQHIGAISLCARRQKEPAAVSPHHQLALPWQRIATKKNMPYNLGLTKASTVPQWQQTRMVD